jgi:hypothetical protein
MLSSTTANVLTGWVVDTTAQGWSGIDDVQIFNGLMDGGGYLVAHPVFQLNRPDVATVHDKSPYTMRGSAYDPLAGPGQGTGVDRVQVYLTGEEAKVSTTVVISLP